MHYLPVCFDCITLCATLTLDIQSQDALNVTPVYTLYFGISCRSTYVQLSRCDSPYWARASSLLRLHDHTQTHHIR
jgi:hypothetical protein